jgi:hypothetical protein
LSALLDSWVFSARYLYLQKKEALEGESRAKFSRGKNSGMAFQPADNRIL